MMTALVVTLFALTFPLMQVAPAAGGPGVISAVQVWYLAAGLLGSFLKSWVTNTQATWSKKSAVDVLIGGLTAVLIPSLLPSIIPTGVNLFAQAVAVAVLSYTSSDLVSGIIAKLTGAPPPKPNGG